LVGDSIRRTLRVSYDDARRHGLGVVWVRIVRSHVYLENKEKEPNKAIDPTRADRWQAD
jgi:hypothetical protein